MLTEAIILAAQAHEGQLDKGGHPYIFHPLRLMLQLESEKDRIIAILHDVIEDTDWTLDKLREEGFSEEIVSVIDSLSRREEENYEEYIGRLMRDPTACRIKLLDLRDNRDLTRIRVESADVRERVKKYQRAQKRIQEALAKDPEQESTPQY